MNSPASPVTGNVAEANGAESAGVSRKLSGWYQSIWFDLAIALVAGFLYALLVMGPQPLNPRNVNWIAFDPAYHYIGWELYRQDPHLHWPLTYTDRLGYPEGESVALLDLNPLMAVVLKPVSFLLPEPSQYFGLEVILCCTLQFFFAFRLLRMMVKRAERVRAEGPQGLKPYYGELGSARLKPCPDTKQVPSAEADSGKEIGGVDAGLKASSTVEAGSTLKASSAVRASSTVIDLLAAALGAAFFLLAPPLNYRFWGHYSLSNQWLLVASLYVFARAQQAAPNTVRRFVISAAILTAIVTGTNPYLAFQVLLLLIAGVASLLWQKRLSVAKSAGVVAMLMAIGFVVAYSLGLVISGGKGYSSGGYRDLSMNLLALFDPRTFTSIIFPRLHSASPGQYEGYNYLGGGVLIIAVVVIVAAIIRKGKLPRPDKRWFVPLAACCLLLTLLALSTKITLGGRTLIDIDPDGKLTPLFAPLRSTGRLFWAPYYAILAAILAAPFLLFRRAWATLLIGAMFVLQFADTAALRQWVRSTISDKHPSPLKSAIWSRLGAQHQNLIVLPAWQCEHAASPGGIEGYRIFGFLAAAQKMRTNSYQSARYTGVAQDFHCSQAVEQVEKNGLAADTAYVVMPDVAAAIAQGPTGAGKCHDLDNFILCSTKTDFGLSPVLMTTEQRAENGVANPGLEDGTTAPWSTSGARTAVSTVTAHGGTYSLAMTGAGTAYQDINGLEPGATYTVSAWVAGTAGASTTAELIVYDMSDNVSPSSRIVQTSPVWQQLTRSFKVGREGAIRINLARGPSDGTVYWDDIHLSQGTSSK